MITILCSDTYHSVSQRFTEFKQNNRLRCMHTFHVLQPSTSIANQMKDHPSTVDNDLSSDQYQCHCFLYI